MRNKWPNEACVYCGVAKATTGDHVFGRKFFLEKHRGNLPQVPTCEPCNNAKAALEAYLMAVMPFGARHTDALDNLTSMVPPRLAKNAKLHQSLNQGQGRAWGNEGGVTIPVMTLPIDSDKAAQLFRFITKGLLWHHCGVLLDPIATGVWAGFLSPLGVKVHRSLLAMNGAARISENLGDGTFTYEGLQGTDSTTSIWTFSMYGGVKLSGDPDAPNEEATVIGGVTTTAAGLEKLMAQLSPDLRPRQPEQPIPNILMR